jgi:hypothetical protein
MTKRETLTAVFTFVFLGLMATAQAKEPLEYQLASLNAKSMVASDHITVARFRSLLNQLDAAYVEDKQQIADMSVVAQQSMKRDGIDESLLNIMEGMNQLFSVKVTNQRYAEYAAAYVTLRDSGQSHAQAISGLQALLRRLVVR